MRREEETAWPTVWRQENIVFLGKSNLQQEYTVDP